MSSTKQFELHEELIPGERRPQVVTVQTDKTVHSWLVVSTLVGVAALVLSGVAYEKAYDASNSSSNNNKAVATPCASASSGTTSVSGASVAAMAPPSHVTAMQKNAVFHHIGNLGSLSMSSASNLDARVTRMVDNATGFAMHFMNDPLHAGDAHVTLTDLNTLCQSYLHIFGNGPVTSMHYCPSATNGNGNTLHRRSEFSSLLNDGENAYNTIMTGGKMVSSMTLMNAAANTMRKVGDDAPSWSNSMLTSLHHNYQTAMSSHGWRRDGCFQDGMNAAGRCLGCSADIYFASPSAMSNCAGCAGGSANAYANC
jgi:hypothetical protein